MVTPQPRYRFELFVKLRRHAPQVFESLARRYGDRVRLQVGGNTLHLLSHPDDIHHALTLSHTFVKKGRTMERAGRLLGHGLLNSHGEAHLSQRHLMQPAFHRTRLLTYGEAMIEETLALSRRWERRPWVDVHREMMDLTLNIVCRTLLGVSVEQDMDRIRPHIDTAVNAFSLLESPLHKVYERLPFGPGARFQVARQVLDELIYRMIKDHRRSGEDRGDLLSMLLLSGMSDVEVRDQVMTMFMAGHETTANAMTWTWYLLAQHPQVVALLNQELEAVLGSQDPSPQDAARLPYSRQVLAEAMRLYPPAWAIARRALQDIPLGEDTIPQDMFAIVSQWVVHHDPRWYPEPYRFDPARWTPEQEAARPRMAYFPFGAGTRMCIGEHFAWQEAILALAILARRWRLHRIGNAPMGTVARITLRPSRPVLMRLEKRTVSADKKQPAYAV